VLSKELYPTVVEQSLPGAHESLQVKAQFPAMIELEVKNLTPLGADSEVAIFSWI